MARATTKKEIARRIAESLGSPQKLTHDVIQAFLDGVIEELARGNRLEFREFGVFSTVLKTARAARNPRTGEAVRIPERRAVRFKAGRKMKLRVQESAPESGGGSGPAPAAPAEPGGSSSGPSGPSDPPKPPEVGGAE